MSAGPTVRLIAFLVLTGVLAVTLIATLLLLGVTPRLVFAPGFAIKTWCEAHGCPVHTRVGVICTALIFWAAIVAVWLTVTRVLRRKLPA